MEDSSSAFSSLKPVCIKLSQSALSLSNGRSSPADVAKAQTDVLTVLRSVAETRPAALTPQLADYVFFPLSHVLRQYLKLPLRALEDCLSCTHILLKTSWRKQLDPKLGIQLLILLAVLADTQAKPNRPVLQPTEELQVIIQKCFAESFLTLSRTKPGREALLDAKTLPHLGKAVFEILDKLKDGSSSTIQLGALDAIQAFLSALDDEAALGTSFFPGLVSSIQKVLVPTANHPRTVHLLVRALGMLSELLIRTLGDTKVRDLPPARSVTAGNDQANDQLDQSWLAATSGQVQTVLATVVKLRSHGRSEVRTALLKLCLALITHCRKSLSDAIPFLLETAIVLLDDDEERGTAIELQTVLTLDDTLADMLRASLHGWLVALPRVMQSTDDSARQKLLLQISNSFKMLSTCGLDASIIDRLLADQLKAGMAGTLRKSSAAKVDPTVPVEASPTSELTLISTTAATAFAPVFVEDHSSHRMMTETTNLLRTLAGTSSGKAVAQQLVSSIEGLEGNEQIASFWASLELLRLELGHSTAADEFLAFQSASDVQLQDMMEQLYSISLEYINPSVFEGERDWRIQALALESIALFAQQHGKDFGSELIDALYPIVHLIGSNNALLRRHAMTCLNIVASSTGHANARELIIANVDYLVNSVALKLNAFDISAQAPQVLLMMVKLTGPRLLPYLDDLVDSMFAALDAYHGYPRLVEMIFAVLLGIAQEGAKSDQLRITVDDRATRQSPLQRCSVDDAANTLRRLKRKRHQGLSELSREASTQGHPKRPWTEGLNREDQPPNEMPDIGLDRGSEAQNVPAPVDSDGDNNKPPAPKTYSLLLKISELTQHYLTSASPSLRTSLLALLHTTFPALAKHEDSFLPLINTLWPSIVSRLDDGETYVVANALDTIAVICDQAGDFMRGRITALWPELKRIATSRAHLGVTKPTPSLRPSSNQRRDVSDVVSIEGGGKRTSSELQRGYVDAPTRLLQDAIFNVFKAIVEHAGIDADVFEEMVGIAQAQIASRLDLLRALEKYNEDTVWLMSERARQTRRVAELATSNASGAVGTSLPFVEVA